MDNTSFIRGRNFPQDKEASLDKPFYIDENGNRRWRRKSYWWCKGCGLKYFHSEEGADRALEYWSERRATDAANYVAPPPRLGWGRTAVAGVRITNKSTHVEIPQYLVGEPTMTARGRECESCVESNRVIQERNEWLTTTAGKAQLSQQRESREAMIAARQKKLIAQAKTSRFV